MTKDCLNCEKEFKCRNKDQKFCGAACYCAWRTGPNHPAYKGGHRDARGYRKVCVNGIHDWEHRLAMQQKLGRPLRKGETVHHLNGDRSDNRLENLSLFPSHSDHLKSHATFRSETHKECSRCHETKTRDQFRLRSSRRPTWDLHRSHCRQCENALAKASQRLIYAAMTPEQRRALHLKQKVARDRKY